MSNEITIGKDVFAVTPLLGEESFVFQTRVMPIAAEVFAIFDLRSDSADLGSLLAVAAPAIGRICAKMPPEELRTIMRTLLRGATMNGQRLYSETGNPIDVLLRGRTLDIWKLLLFALKVSYPDFFGLLRASESKRAAESGSETSTTSSPGRAGDLL